MKQGENTTKGNGEGRFDLVLVTGGDGYIGSHLTRLLLERGYRVRVMSNFMYHGGKPIVPGVGSHPNLELFVGDVRNLRDLRKSLAGVDAVIALAAIVGEPACSIDEDETVTTNYESVLALAQAAAQCRINRLIYASTCSVYGAAPDFVLNEGSRKKALGKYAETRLLAELELMGKERGFTTTALRLGTIFGLSPRMRFDLMVNTMTAEAWANGVIRVSGRNQWRPHVHAKDAARAFIAALEADHEVVHREVFNVGGNDLNKTIGEVAEIVLQEVPRARIEYCDDGAPKRDYKVSFDKIRHVLGFEPEIDLSAGVREILHALETGVIRDYRDPVYNNAAWLRRMWGLEHPHADVKHGGKLHAGGQL